MPSVEIVRLETVKGNDNVNLFDPFNDPIVLRTTVNFSSDILALPQPLVTLTYQIIELKTDVVFEQWAFQFAVTDPGIYHWITLPTAHNLGLNWIGTDIFGARAAAEIFNFDGLSGLEAIDAMDVTPVHWFRFEPLAGV
jgi:hypothetical protein